VCMRACERVCVFVCDCVCERVCARVCAWGTADQPRVTCFFVRVSAVSAWTLNVAARTSDTSACSRAAAPARSPPNARRQGSKFLFKASVGRFRFKVSVGSFRLKVSVGSFPLKVTLPLGVFDESYTPRCAADRRDASHPHPSVQRRTNLEPAAQLGLARVELLDVRALHAADLRLELALAALLQRYSCARAGGWRQLIERRAAGAECNWCVRSGLD
jgi:hypothetical protein